MRRTKLVVALAIAVVAVVVLVAAPVLARGGGPGPTPATGQGRAAGPGWATGMGAGLGTGAGLYAAFAYDAPVFDRIAAAESSHLTAVRSLLERYQVADPTAGKAPGKFAAATVQASYDRLLKQGRVSQRPMECSACRGCSCP